MAKVRFNIKASRFPLLTGFMGQQVAIRAQGDSDYITTDAYSGVSANDEIGIAQPMYMHNVLPASHGLQSIDYSVELDNSCAGQAGFDKLIPLRDFHGLNHMLSPANGQNYVSTDGETWASTSLPTDVRMSGSVSYAYVKQQTYVCYRNQGVFRYDPISGTLQPITLIGLDTDQVSGITSAMGMLIAWTDDTIYRSSFENPIDFTPSLRTGAGSQQVIEIRGLIISCLPHTQGFMIYASENSVYAQGTSDLAYPFRYREVQGSSGIISARHVASDTTFGVHYAWTKAGLQSIRNTEAKLLFPELTDFLTCGFIEDYINSWDDCDRIGSNLDRVGHDPFQEGYYSECPNNLKMIPYTLPLEIRVNVIATRYLAISYGIGTLSHIIVYDLGLARFGKLRIPHVDVFNYQEPETFGVDTARESFGILQENGNIRAVDFKLSQPATDSILLFGRISQARDSTTLLDTFQLAGLFNSDGGLKVNLITSQDGMTMPEDIYLIPFHDSSVAKEYGARATGAAHIIKMIGTFSLSGIVCNLFPGGNR